MKYYLIQTEDEKTLRWSESFRGDVELRAVKGSAVYFLLSAIGSCFTPKCKGFIFRYLNDYPSLPKTCARALLEAITILLGLATSKKIYWICHNVDKESHTAHRQINALRRWVLSKLSCCIFVTDPRFIPAAKKAFVNKAPIRAISFGPKMTSTTISHKNNSEIQAWAKSKRSNGCDVLIWCSGSYAPKTLHYSYLRQLLGALRDLGYTPAAYVACGNLPEPLKLQLCMESDVEVVDQRFDFDEQAFFKYFDFNFKIYQDVSMPYSLYVSVEESLPIITRQGDVLSEIVSLESLGVVVDFAGNIGLDTVAFDAYLITRIRDESVSNFFDKRCWDSLCSAIEA